MYDAWPWFREHVDLIAMILAKADLGINANYDAQARTLPPERGRVSRHQEWRSEQQRRVTSCHVR